MTSGMFSCSADLRLPDERAGRVAGWRVAPRAQQPTAHSYGALSQHPDVCEKIPNSADYLTRIVGQSISKLRTVRDSGGASDGLSRHQCEQGRQTGAPG